MKNQGYVADAFLERFGAALGCQMLDFGIQNLQNITKMAIEINPKSMKIEVASRMRFWSVFGAPKGDRPNVETAHFGGHFRQKIEKMTSKKASKIRCRKSIEN